MKTIYFDTEFSEGFFKPIDWLPKWIPGNKPRWSIELISIGMVDDQGKEYYAINKDFKRSRCNDWVKANVLTKLPLERVSMYDSPRIREDSLRWKSIERIKADIMAFVNPTSGEDTLNNKRWNTHLNKFNVVAAENRPIQFKAYYADYDWVMLCTIFGTMMDLPNGFPMYCIDLKQVMDEKVLKVYPGVTFYSQPNEADSFDLKLKWFKGITGYPPQNNEHSALDDAKWNLQLDQFIATL